VGLEKLPIKFVIAKISAISRYNVVMVQKHRNFSGGKRPVGELQPDEEPAEPAWW
jgi:hypothetical protein